MHKEA